MAELVSVFVEWMVAGMLALAGVAYQAEPEIDDKSPRLRKADYVQPAPLSNTPLVKAEFTRAEHDQKLVTVIIL